MSQSNKSYHGTVLTIIFLLLTVIGLANLYSAGNESMYFDSQFKRMFVGLFCYFLFGWFVPIKHVNTYAYLYFGIIVFSLIIVLLLGHTAGGAQRWLILGPVRFQPSEFAKLAIAIVVAKFFYHNRSLHTYAVQDIWPILATICLVFTLIFKQPDFGTAGICFLIGLCQVAFIRIEIGIKTIVSLFVSAITLGFVGWHFLLLPYQKLRILNLLNPNLDPSGSGYNSLQSLVAVGSGMQFGKGYLQGTQTQLQFLPARHTDFIFSVFAEEHGFWGCAVIFLMFIFIAYLALEIARESRDCFNKILAIGIAAIITVEFTLNVAMVLGLFPVVGMPLPFFSYGGSAMLTVCISIGLLVAIDRENAKGSKSRRLESI